MAKTIIVTGASRGIGHAIAHYLIKQGHNVILSARSRELLEDFQATCPKRIRVVPGDITDPKIGEIATELAAREFGQLDGLVINHGVLAPVSRISEANVEEWKENFDVNFFSAVAFIKAAVPALRKTNGRIIITSSGAAVHPYSTWGAYSTSKAALKSLGTILAAEEKKIATISIAPGVVDTDMQKELRDNHIGLMDKKDQQKFTSLKAEGKLLRPEQPGNVMARLVLEAPLELSGAMLRWDDSELAEFQER